MARCATDRRSDLGHLADPFDLIEDAVGTTTAPTIALHDRFELVAETATDIPTGTSRVLSLLDQPPEPLLDRIPSMMSRGSDQIMKRVTEFHDGIDEARSCPGHRQDSCLSHDDSFHLGTHHRFRGLATVVSTTVDKGDRLLVGARCDQAYLQSGSGNVGGKKEGSIHRKQEPPAGENGKPMTVRQPGGGREDAPETGSGKLKNSKSDDAS